MSGGDAIDSRVLETWGSMGKLVNAWGPTETCIGNTLGFVAADSSSSNVGEAYPSSTVIIVDLDRRTIVPLGAQGEIAIAGQLAEGYVGREDLTKEVFVTLPSGLKVYLTGDAGRISANGQLHCLGRIDKSLVKINSQRVELDEISAHLRKAEQVSDAITLYTKHPERPRKQLVAFLTLKGASKGDGFFREDTEAASIKDKVIAGLRGSLPGYMIPIHTYVLSQPDFPLTINNKVDGKALETRYHQTRLSRTKAEEASSQPLSESAELVRSHIAKFAGVSESELQGDTSERRGIGSLDVQVLIIVSSQVC